MTTVSVLWFAQLRERRGCAEERFQLAENETAAALFARACPTEARAGLPVRFAVNGASVSGTEPLVDGDEVVFLPPVGGG